MEGFEVCYLFFCESCVLYVGFVEDENYGKFGFIENWVGVEYVGYECRCWWCVWCVDDVGDDGWEWWSERFKKNCFWGGLNKDFDLIWCVDKDVFDRFVIGFFWVGFCMFFEEVDDLINFCCEEVKRC